MADLMPVERDDRAELLETILRQHGPAMCLYARQWCDSPDDVVQEALVQLAIEKALPGNPIGWLYRVVRNRAIDCARRTGRQRRREQEVARQNKCWFADQVDPPLDPAHVSDSLARLPVEQREVIVAYLWSGLTFSEIGELAGCSTAAAHRRYKAGLTRLREMIDDDES